MSENGEFLPETDSGSSNTSDAAEDAEEVSKEVGRGVNLAKATRTAAEAEKIAAATRAAVKSRDDWFSDENHAINHAIQTSEGMERDDVPGGQIEYGEKYRFSPVIPPTAPSIPEDIDIHYGDTVELKNGAFIRILEINGDKFRGLLFESNTRLGGWLPRAEKEVFWLWTFSQGCPETARPALIMAQKSEVRKNWNQPTANPTLICRWKYVRACAEKINRADYQKTAFSKSYFEEKSLIRIDEDSDPLSMPLSGERSISNLTKTLHHMADKSSEKLGTTKRPSSLADKDLPKYTFGDAFSGCGGMSRGADMAGLNVRWGFDIDPTSIKAFHRNFPNAIWLEEWAHEFVSRKPDAKFEVDVLHFSTPCKYFSTAHGVSGKDDDLNSSSLFAIPKIVQKTNPRVVTLEQVPNIVAHPEYFTALIQFFTFSEYSIRWKVINCADFGVAQQSRLRLFLIASRAGTVLPNFPLPTHSREQWKTVLEAIKDIPTDCSDNELPPFRQNTRWEAYDGNKPHRYVVIARDNQKIYRPNGKQPMTIREVGCLQSFPFHHSFEGRRTDKWRQIGNAVPPMVGQAILNEVKRSLMVTDGIHGDVEGNTVDVNAECSAPPKK